jgi:hypothetical protein
MIRLHGTTRRRAERILWFPLSQGVVQFDPGAGLEELLAAWPELAVIRSV